MLSDEKRFSELLNYGFSSLKNLIVPPLCMQCEQIVDVPGVFCPKCWNSVRFISKPYCEVLGIPFRYSLGEGTLSAEAIANPPSFKRARSAVLYDENMRALVSQLKYSDKTEFAPWMANWMRQAGRELLNEKPVIVPIPLHRFRMFTRRYNQSAELGRHIAKQEELSFEPNALLRVKNTKQQVGLNRLERARNVQGAFRVPVEFNHLVKGKNILLIDDVFTTGATVNAATNAVNRAGAKAVDVLTFARVETFDI